MGEAITQLLGGGCGLYLLLHPPTLICQLDNELCHAYARQLGVAGLSGEFFLEFKGTSFCFRYS